MLEVPYVTGYLSEHFGDPGFRTLEGYERLGGYKIPRRYEFVSELPRNASGKILKRVLREPFWKGQARGVA